MVLIWLLVLSVKMAKPVIVSLLSYAFGQGIAAPAA
jgi:hypothetical protein